MLKQDSKIEASTQQGIIQRSDFPESESQRKGAQIQASKTMFITAAFSQPMWK